MGASFLFWALLLLTLPLNWLVAAVLAAAWHEACHYVCLRLLGGRAEGFRPGLSGAVLDVSGLTLWGEFATSLAGPLGGLLLTLLWQPFPRLALCAAIQSAFNLLPVYPLDGGRALRCGMDVLIPTKAVAVCQGAQWLCLGLLLALGVRFHLWFPLIWVSLGLLTRKRPCKASLLKVQ